MNILSLFDGISCGRIALNRAGIQVDKYYASEIDPYAIKVSSTRWPANINLGDVQKINLAALPNIDLLISGSPCQGFSRAGKELNFDDPRSALFFDFVRILKTLKPKYFLLENVVMRKEYQDIISEILGEYVNVKGNLFDESAPLQPIKICSSLVSAQHRERLYWTNISGITQPEDKHIMLKDIVLEDGIPIALHNLYGGVKESSVRVFTDKSLTIRTSTGVGHIPSFIKKDWIHSAKAIEYMNRKVAGGRNHWDFGHHSDINNPKSAAVVANFFKGVPYNVFKDWDCIRMFHPVECERLQTLPDGYTDCGISNTQRYRQIGNGWTVDIIAWIFSFIKGESK